MIPQIQPWIDDSEWLEVKKVMESTYLTENQVTAEFEAQIQDLTGAKHAIAVCNGTAALYCILKALDIGQADEVLVPNMTFVASSNAVIMAGAKPIFCPVKADTLCIDVEAAAKLVNENTKGIMPVHLYGQSADMEAVLAFAEQFNLKVIEDAAQAIGVKFNGRHVGYYGDAGAFSFYGNKTITCGEGGIITTDSDIIAQTCRRLKNHGRSRRGTFVHEHIGFNFSMTEMQAAVGIAQLRKLPAIIERKRQIHEAYMAGLADVTQLKPFLIDERCEPVYWFTSFYAENRAELADYLKNQGIQTRILFCPLHLQPCYEGWADPSVDYSVSISAYETGLSLPSSYILTDEELDYIIAQIHQFYQSREQAESA
ncbi:DegT/DnrJ/EryC1/StrS family aminotransferase [Limnoraphis robusta Tam1]|uniref:DegT/DnrJ/EryC1/StrS family aminotransferase n=1 Tax=Limnoraphis robusta TaxID=1118279 RepID=UPI002B1F9CB3|nr:DegT/DnrJ/EryC1/StrS family aminotransferase [Limnoraphis robusta]MEA5498094.1 DegT/DnrJ/EryC1/StrS family aminotransferase [Limnoraphis robusta BA-68 BA1]MEA5541853.1 DegT/DnrJ/EryC1/StrS family aminotransferase [Limnoraphis robusta Tam1]